MDRLRIVIVNVAFRGERFYRRWEKLTEDYNVDVTLIGPQVSSFNGFGNSLEFRPVPVDKTYFRVHHINMNPRKLFINDFISPKFFRVLFKTKPDFIYIIGFEVEWINFLTFFYKKINNRTKSALFSMRGLDMPLQHISYSWRWKAVKHFHDYIAVHYPYGRRVFLEQGKFEGPVFCQTQIGVDKEIFYPCSQSRIESRAKHSIATSEFVFIYLARIHVEKGILDLIEACALLEGGYKLLILGDGDHMKRATKRVSQLGLEEYVSFMGFVADQKEIAKLLNASDCLVHIPRTTESWVDTFPLAVVQGMACGLPVIGSNSGAVPYQLGEKGIIVNEGSPVDVASAMQDMLKDRAKARKIGANMLTRSNSCFEINHLNNLFIKTIYATSLNKSTKSLDQHANR